MTTLPTHLPHVNRPGRTPSDSMQEQSNNINFCVSDIHSAIPTSNHTITTTPPPVSTLPMPRRPRSPAPSSLLRSPRRSSLAPLHPLPPPMKPHSNTHYLLPPPPLPSILAMGTQF
ncbi:unnamed protein product [Schistocephalus solidus]|uniref:Ovule protein n=1 Tax=Schistocephalus solidus TaxID=70667 RepID=A0A183T1Y1_SCHSO|nr:unnamed protein product [Schistocephalus solidus]